MRWIEKIETRVGTIRRRTRFLWWPKRIGSEWRWLEITTWTEKYIERLTHESACGGRVPAPPSGWIVREWIPVKWGDTNPDRHLITVPPAL